MKNDARTFKQGFWQHRNSDMQKDLFNEGVIEESFKADCDIGNKTLYALCEKYPLYDNPSEDAFRGQIWLIGRSYAASPERRHYKWLGKGNKDNNPGQGGNGLDTFFKRLAQELLKDPKFEKIIHFIKDNREKHYDFDYSEKDIELLFQVGDIVNSFNNVLKEAIKRVDKKYLAAHPDAEINNFISFSSKYMHFQLRNIVFIKDSISAAHLSKMGIKADNEKLKSAMKNKQCSEYHRHIVKEYVFGCMAKEQNIPYITLRNIDTYVMLYGSETEI